MPEDAPIEPGFTLSYLDHGFVRYIDHMGSDQRILEAARISYRSASKGDEKDKKLLAYLYKNRHYSPFEMCKVTFNIKMPIFVMRQYVRHRAQSLNEVSARYTELPCEFYVPEEWRVQDTKNKQGSVAPTEEQAIDHEYWTDSVNALNDAAYKLYQDMIEAGIAREQARSVLPVSIYTEIYCTWDLRNLLHFLSLREDAHAQLEIQELAHAMKQIAKELFPWTLEAYERYKPIILDMEHTDDEIKRAIKLI